ncbi:kinase-like domain-containing protein [Myxozyma melibiosi]|uniref:non-specific serine/threonine protein kinase n=1 Tax=Myxozyma melibiosi TaxID=54550 RepID=A0ABR1F925_9ASCO
MTRRSTDSAGSTSRRSSIANRVLSEISNTTSNRSSNASSISPGVKRLSTGQRVSSAIQHFQRITSGSSASAQSFTASSHPSISRPFQVERNGVLLDQEQHPSPTDSYHSSMLPPTVHENNDDEYEDDTDHTSYSRRASTSVRSNRFSTAPTEVDSINANRYSTASAYGEPAVYHPSSSDSAQNSQFQLSSSPTKSSSSDDTGYEPHAAADKRVSQLSTCTTGSSASSRGHKHKTHVGPWRLGRTLGRGSSGRVRLAKHSKTGKLAAVKIVPKSASFEDPANPESQARGKDAAGLPYGIEREVIIMKLIEHPNVMGLYDVWENHGELYLILEYVEGGELFDYLIRKGRLDEREAVHYFRQIILGVDYCHKFNICHRDLKPENLLLDKHHNIKIADFGMAALEATGKMLETSCGSPHYASPEIVAGKTYHGSQSDIWSCGVILFALLTGHLPFDDENIRNLLMKVQTGKFQMPSDLSIHAKDLIWRILKINPEDRITAEEILSHPLLRKYPSKDANANISRAPTVPVHHPINSREEVDVEIVKNLQTLWHGEDREVIIDRLLSPELNPEKTFYCLLMKYRHDHIDDSSSAENTPRTSPHQNRRKQSIGNNAMVKQPAKPAAALQRQTTPTRVSRHKKTASKGSVRSIASSHRKRGVDFSHVSKKVQGSTSTPSIKSQNSIQRRPQQPEYEPPLPESSSMLIAAIDQLSQSMAREPSSISAAKEQSRSIINAQRPQVDQTRVPVPGPVPRTAVPRRNPPVLETKKTPMVLEDYANLSSPVEQIPGLRLDYSVRSAKEQKSRPGTAATLPEDDEVRKISAEFAASLCETMFNFGGPSTRNVSDSSTESQPRTVSTSSEASTASTAPTSVGGRTPVMADAEFGKDTTGPLRLNLSGIWWITTESG